VSAKINKGASEPLTQSSSALSAQPQSSDPCAPHFAHICVVLVGTQLGRNLGSAARAMKTMGLCELRLVNPQQFPSEDATALAAGAQDVLASARVFSSLADAIADCHWVAATSARRRGIVIPDISAQACARHCQTISQGSRIAIVFGAERTGLSNEDIQQCHARVEITANPDYASLNLAQAVQIVAYELRLAALAKLEARVPIDANSLRDAHQPATQGELESFFAHWEQLLNAANFYRHGNPDVSRTRMRRLFQRAAAASDELSMLRGVMTDLLRKLPKPD
jgi:tRNA (cytidine32/uridine32-2'-O)-methyltransferase